MAENIILRYNLNKDKLFKGGLDHEIICRLDIEPSRDYRKDHTSVYCDVCLVLDASQSMNGLFAQGASISKREGVIRAAKSVIPNLDPNDSLSLVFYDSSAYPVAERLPGSSRDDIARYIDTLNQYSGATNFEAALKTARSILAKGKNANRRIIFLTDGQVNQGDADEVKKTVSALRRESVTIDGLGVGADFDFHYMRSLSGPSNGRTFLLGTPEEAEQRFKELLEGAQKSVADNVFLTAMFAPGLRDIEAYQWLPEMRYYGVIKPGPDGRARLEVNVQNLRQDRRNIFFFKVRMDPPGNGNMAQMAALKLDYDLPPIRQTGLQETLNIHAGFSGEPNAVEYDTSVDEGFAEVELAKLYEHFEHFRDTDWTKALAVLEKMIQRAKTLGDRTRFEEYTRYKEKLKTDNQLSDDDINRVGSLSSQSTQSAEGYLPDPGEGDILSGL